MIQVVGRTPISKAALTPARLTAVALALVTAMAPAARAQEPGAGQNMPGVIRDAETEQLLRDQREKPSGELRITTTVAFGSTWLTPRMAEFLTLYPDITVDLILEDRELDLGMGQADVAIRMRAPIQ